MKVEVLQITPQLAAEMLRNNERNRAIRRTSVEALKAAFQRGEYVTTHQGVAFSSDGRLLDGQHRLTAISELRDGRFPMVVTTGLDDAAFVAIDVGLRRTAADVLGHDRRLVEEARLIGEICRTTRGAVTIPQIGRIAEFILPAHERLLGFCGTSSKTFGAVSSRTAAIVQMMSGGDEDYVKSQYRALVLFDIAAMSTIAQALVKAEKAGRVVARDRFDMFVRCMDVFNIRKASNAKVQVSSPDQALDMVRNKFSFLLEGQEKADPTGSAKSVLPFHYRTA